MSDPTPGARKLDPGDAFALAVKGSARKTEAPQLSSVMPAALDELTRCSGLASSSVVVVARQHHGTTLAPQTWDHLGLARPVEHHDPGAYR
jgi:hypothetical protein